MEGSGERKRHLMYDVTHSCTACDKSVPSTTLAEQIEFMLFCFLKVGNDSASYIMAFHVLGGELAVMALAFCYQQPSTNHHHQNCHMPFNQFHKVKERQIDMPRSSFSGQQAHHGICSQTAVMLHDNTAHRASSLTQYKAVSNKVVGLCGLRWRSVTGF